MSRAELTKTLEELATRLFGCPTWEGQLVWRERQMLPVVGGQELLHLGGQHASIDLLDDRMIREGKTIFASDELFDAQLHALVLGKESLENRVDVGAQGFLGVVHEEGELMALRCLIRAVAAVLGYAVESFGRSSETAEVGEVASDVVNVDVLSPGSVIPELAT